MIPQLGAVIELAVLDGYNHNSETTIAVSGDDVVIVSINQLLESAESFRPSSASAFRRVGVYVSHDGGERFAAPVALDDTIDNLTDPVVRVAADGTFFVAGLDLRVGVRLWSSSNADVWTLVADALDITDKEWIAIDDRNRAVYVAGVGGMYALAFDGSIRGHEAVDITSRNATDAYVDADGVHVLAMSREVLRWDGAGEVELEVRPVFAGDRASVWTTIGALGPREDGGQWIVRTQRFTGHAPLILGVRRPGEAKWTERRLSSDGDTTFLPAAALDAENRLHLVYYDTTGEQGVLRYMRSRSSDLEGPFGPSIVLDPDACPGNGWYPYPSNDPLRNPGGRRLREYIGIAIEGNRVHVSWAHAPDAPARVYTTYLDYE
jgi:hypothetical protein